MKLKFFLIFFIALNQVITAQFLEKQKEVVSYNGFFNFHYNEHTDEIYLEVSALDAEFLYVHSLSTGLGSNDIGLDRGQIGGGVVVKFKKAGNKLLLVQSNQKYRAITDNELEARSVEEAFGISVLFGFPIKEEKEGNYIIDLTPFLLQDAHGVSRKIASLKAGKYTMDSSRSALSLERTKAFPDNIEFEALTTFKGVPTDRSIGTVSPDARFLTFIQHHSFVKLPDANYQKRVFDPRSGALSISYFDYATPIQETIEKKYIVRHRLKKKYPDQSMSVPQKPIIYYLDPGTPEPIRSALLEGASWWNQAYEAIGYKDAFQVKMLPKNVDPMDVRYNVIQWVHRSTRGWSYGASVIDPRTGEIIKGHVSLGSLRIRQDYLIAQALMDRPFLDTDTNYTPMLEMALARIRQLSAHEVGHTLGFAHNFAASATYRASVMDYPHPLVTLSNGKIELSKAYDAKIGAWDKVSVAYSYSEFKKEANEREELTKILEGSYTSGLRFITDRDARAEGGAHGLAHLWDNNADAAIELERVLKIRKTAIHNFSIHTIRSGEPYAVLEDVFVPLYFFHRYQTAAATKTIGGLWYTYAVKGDQQKVVDMIAARDQHRALEQLLKTLSPEVLAIPEDKLTLFPPRAFGFPRTRESFKGKTGVGFDAISVAATASNMTLRGLLHTQRASRLVQQKSRDHNQLGLLEVLNRLVETVFVSTSKNRYHQEIRQVVRDNTLQHLMRLSVDTNAYPQVNAIAYATLQKIATLLQNEKVNGVDGIYNEYYVRKIRRFIEKPTSFTMVPLPKIPDGAPIGSGQCGF